jgi:hypothetical protein
MLSAFDPARDQVLVWSRSERAPKPAAEMCGRGTRRAGRCCDVERLVVPRVDQVAGAE